MFLLKLEIYNYQSPKAFKMFPNDYSYGYPIPLTYTSYENHYYPTDNNNLNLYLQATQIQPTFSQPQIYFTYNQPLPSNTFSMAIHQQQINQRDLNHIEAPLAVRSRRKNNPLKQLQSAKKNSESNILNQLYSFFNCCDESQRIVRKAIQRLNKNKSDQQKISVIFYKVFRLIVLKRGRKYINKDQVIQFYRPQTMLLQIPEINDKLLQVNILTLAQLCTLFRMITSYFVREISINALLTSKRIKPIAKLHHLIRRRLVLEHISSNNQE